MKNLKTIISALLLSLSLGFALVPFSYADGVTFGDGKEMTESEIEKSIEAGTAKARWLIFQIAGGVALIVLLITGVLWMFGQRELVIKNSINLVGGVLLLVVGGGLLQVFINSVQ